MEGAGGGVPTKAQRTQIFLRVIRVIRGQKIILKRPHFDKLGNEVGLYVHN